MSSSSSSDVGSPQRAPAGRRPPRARETGPYRLVLTPPAVPDPPRLDAAQRTVVEHTGGPLLVLGGPGAGKTSTLVEAVCARLAAGTDPERVLVLTFSRKAAVDLRDRIALRHGPENPAGVPQATTFHSFCYALLRSHQDSELFRDPLRLLSGPEQDVAVRELLAGQIDLHRRGLPGTRWPAELRACLTTRGFADEVRAVLARSRELGLGPGALDDFARRLGRPDWLAAADFLAEYLDVLDMQGVLDYAELVHRAVLLAGRPEAATELAGRYDAVYVDEYQDTDPAQVRLLRALVGAGAQGRPVAPLSPGTGGPAAGRTLVAFGDPDQSVFAFRGADVNGILDFPEAFRRTDGGPAPVAVLTTSWRSAAVPLAATRLLTRRMPLSRLPSEAVRAHRELLVPDTGPGRPTGPASAEAGPVGRHRPAQGSVEVFTYPTPGAELENIADLLRRAHLEDGVPWGEMAVLVRAGARSLPVTRRVLTAAGVPLDLDGDELPLRHEPAVAPLLMALRVAAEASARGATAGGAEEDGAGPDTEGDAGDAGDTAEVVEGDARPVGSAGPTSGIDAETAHTLLTSPLGGMDTADLRRLGRALREEERAAGNRFPAPSGELLARAVAEPERLTVHDPAYSRGARRLGLLLRAAREKLAAGGTAEEALWELWDGTTWPARLERAVLRGGAAARNADRDLDAVCALFATAARAEERTGGRGALNFLAEVEAQDIAADSLDGRTHTPDAVRLTTAHRAKGRQWRFVVVAGVQEGLWPDLRRRGSLLEADRIGADGLAPPLTPGALLAEERRLFYTAVTRAAGRLVVTAVKAAADDGDHPSRFLAELGVEPREVTGRPRRPLAVPSLVAELRATTVDAEVSPALRQAAAERLARLAALHDEDGRALVPAAHPARWWGMDEPTENRVPLRDRDLPVALSGSALDQLARTCALQWFLGREVKADSPATAAQGFGNVVHVLADEVASGRTPADLDVLMARLDTVWESLAFDAPWKSVQEKANARSALERFLRWHVENGQVRTAVAGEHDFDVTLKAGAVDVRIRGSMDRVEADERGRAYVVDFKTGKQAPTSAEVARHPQLAVYQLAVREGAVDEVFGGTRPESGGAELVHLRQGAARKDGGEALPKVQSQEPLEGEWVGELLATAAGKVLDERFAPTGGQHCTHCSFRAACSARPEGRQVVE